MSVTDPVDTSELTEVLDESTLPPLADSPGLQADNPDLDDPASAAPFPDPIEDNEPLGPDEEPGTVGE
ncbi:hypothetical protein [Streptomyces sp. SID13031]|uniref:hypothetical protein n=1 Tax=Streptomyces sp. SID13031 TaxID=2706046 RepID=UPI0013C81523|nr:hypothetical protein [Streptomyces sp. SID13031]NEA35498.1 hypothetical protein [Streptomyces sp. SID13031]